MKMLAARIKHSIVFIFLLLALSNAALSQSQHYPRGTHDVFIAQTKNIRTDLLQQIAPIIEKSIHQGYYPGAVILVGHQGKIIYRGIFGNRRIKPDIKPMRFNTLFDIASLTKVVATTPAIMQLIEQGKLDLDDPVAKYWPAFAKHNKNKITIRELLTHTSGLPAEVKLTNQNDLLYQISKLKPIHLPDQHFLYSDINFIVLAHLVKIITNMRIDQYAKNNIFNPLRMNHTFFLPSIKLRDRIAPTEIMNNQLRWGQVHDPLANAMGGVSGHAGIFSTASDLGIYAQSLLDGGKLSHPYRDGKKHLNYFLGPLTVLKMTTPQTPDNIIEVRGLGWDIDSRYSIRGVLFPIRSFGHTGWTGTSMWIDPTTKTWIILLTSRTHPKPTKNNQLLHDRRTIANIISASITDIKNVEINTSKGETERAYKIKSKNHSIKN